jgi:hypothetical protein
MYCFVPSTYPVHPIIDGAFLRWTASELKKVIAMLQNPEFDSKDIDPDLHQRMAKADDDSSIKCFNLLEGAADGDQDLDLWIRKVEDFC